jgi:hypothetical protein
VDREIGVDLAVPIGHRRPDEGVFIEHLLDQRGAAFERFGGQQPQVKAGQALPRQAFAPGLRHGIHRRGRLALAERGRIQHPRKGPRHEFGVQFPADAKCAQVHADMVGLRIGQRQMMIAQQGRDVRAAGLALLCITEHHHVRDRQRRAHRLGRTRMDLVVQRDALGMALVRRHVVV